MSLPRATTAMTTASDEREPEAWLLDVADMIGGVMEFWGFKRAMGRMWAMLYLSPQPLSAQDLQDRLSMSAGAVSMTMQELLKWGAVKKAWVPGDRRDYFSPETSIWKMVSRVFKDRELALIRSFIETLEGAQRAASQAQKGASAETKKRLRFAYDRISSLLALARIGDVFLGAILAGQKLDVTPIRKFVADDKGE
jgi:DNA-binding transcriptional regulator GbsR (MarR family)